MDHSKVNSFKHVNYLWDDKHANALGADQVALFLYRSNILGADLRITNYGGGNTSCKTIEQDPLTGEKCEVMWIKGSGGDIGTLDRSGIAGLYTERLRNLKNVYQGLADEDRMVGLFNHCIFDLDSRAPSIDTPLHGLLPFPHIDHLHPDALIAIAAAKEGKKITREIWGDTIGWVDWQRPGFDLGLQLEKCLNSNPGIKGIVLGSHGLFTWGDKVLWRSAMEREAPKQCIGVLRRSARAETSEWMCFGGALRAVGACGVWKFLPPTCATRPPY